MAKRKSSAEFSKVAEAMFLGNNRDLKYYLVSKNKALREIAVAKSKELTKEQLSKIKLYSEMIEDMIDLRIFNGKKVYLMPDLIDEIKLERAELYDLMESIKVEVEQYKAIASAIFKRENSYLANAYEELYFSEGQKELRDAIAEYEALRAEFEGYQKEWKALWWVLGVIHRPIGFFEKVLNSSQM